MRNIFDKQYENLEAAYRKTIYRCLDVLLDIRIDQLNTELDLLLLARGYDKLCILTSYNPGSIIHNPEDNQQSLIELISDLDHDGFFWLKGINIDPDGFFPNEHTCWVLGMRKMVGLRLSRKWNQKAYVHYRLGEGPELIWVK